MQYYIIIIIIIIRLKFVVFTIFRNSVKKIASGAGVTGQIIPPAQFIPGVKLA